ncbi:endolytic transglycosylase MltG [Treponema sp.]|uniref:endolytic transglycosylase MltG n=1 Tax=Treponema sp. TaxID=166 RepID=UPI00298D96BE|nr:endolytic transglycosylase MltG [Treponema sp.]MCQ2241433.1 endolytic transglycosylase MltG [Treponema sp.]
MAAAFVAVVLGISFWFHSIKPVTSLEEEYVGKISVPAGTSVRLVAETLEKEKFIRSSKVLYLAIRFNVFNRNEKFTLKSGTYTFRSSMNLKEVYELLQSGEQEYISVSIPEGLTKSKIARLLEEKDICTAAEFLASCSSESLLAEYGIPGLTFEGYLFPDTYFLTHGMKGDEIVRTMVNNFYSKISEIPSFADFDSQKLHDTVILSSVVEREYRIREEAPVIASVFANRLRHNIGLYSCATIEYIITEIQGLPHPGRITYKDLKIDSPYNTYMWAGLPEGPISNPGTVALEAAANPAKTKYYYFVLTDPSTGRHTFSTNFDEHIAAENTNYVSK